MTAIVRWGSSVNFGVIDAAHQQIHNGSNMGPAPRGIFTLKAWYTIAQGRHVGAPWVTEWKSPVP